MDADFEACVANLRNAHTRALSGAEGEAARLKGEVQELTARLSASESQRHSAERRVAELSRALAKLATFKQTLLSTLAQTDDDGDDAAVFARLDAVSLNHPAANHASAPPRFQQSGPLTQPGSTALPASRNTDSSESTYNVDITTRLHHSKTGNTFLASDRTSESSRRVHTHPPLQQQSSSSTISSYTQPPSTNRVTFSTDRLEDPTPHISSSSPGTGSAGSNGVGGLGSVDGREFFKHARSRLSYDDFTNLLNNVKAYNAREQSRHKTLDNLFSLLGERHRDLFDQFEGLLSR
ncbi:hypothetical protein BC830DRAFT_1118619 [Chytriomyces sp. MP71]|nr:hypothetical protein BC830DRAFT_1118619 [Chytriomyces sp. MP71]